MKKYIVVKAKTLKDIIACRAFKRNTKELRRAKIIKYRQAVFNKPFIDKIACFAFFDSADVEIANKFAKHNIATACLSVSNTKEEPLQEAPKKVNSKKVNSKKK